MFLILVHEVGHSFFIYFKGYQLDRIELYPYGGCSKFESLINISFKDELLILLAGPFFQCVGFYLLSFFIDQNYLGILKSYHFLILSFNMLPIYPLDGGKLSHLFLTLLVSFRKSYFFLFVISFFNFMLLFSFSLLFIKKFIFFIVLFFLYVKFYQEVLKFPYYYNKFLLERYLYDFSYLKVKIVNHLYKFKRNRYHFIRTKGNLIDEKEYLKKVFIDLNEERRVL